MPGTTWVSPMPRAANWLKQSKSTGRRFGSIPEWRGRIIMLAEYSVTCPYYMNTTRGCQSCNRILPQRAESATLSPHGTAQARSTVDSDYGDARNNLGAAYGMQGRVDEAVSELERSVRLDPGNRRFHLNLARAYELKGWKEKAEAERRLAEGHK